MPSHCMPKGGIPQMLMIGLVSAYSSSCMSAWLGSSAASATCNTWCASVQAFPCPCQACPYQETCHPYLPETLHSVSLCHTIYIESILPVGKIGWRWCKKWIDPPDFVAATTPCLAVGASLAEARVELRPWHYMAKPPNFGWSGRGATF